MRENRLSFEDFKDYVAGHIKEFLPDQYQDAVIKQGAVVKQNESYSSLNIGKPDDRIQPAINLDRYYEDYSRGRSMQEVMVNMASIVNTPLPKIDIPEVFDYEEVKESLYIRVCDRDANRDFLSLVPHDETDGLAVTAHILMKNRDENDDTLSSILVTNKILESWGISRDQLMEDAKANAPKILPAKYIKMDEFLAATFPGMELPGQDTETPNSIIPMTIVTNNEMVEGASVMFYEGLMDTLAEIAESDLYILPSSRHEIITVPQKRIADYHKLEGVVSLANSNVTDVKDWLSDHVYYYDAKEKILEKAETHEQRISQKKMERDSQTKERKSEECSGNKKPEKRSVLDRLNEKKAQVTSQLKTTTRNRANEISI